MGKLNNKNNLDLNKKNRLGVDDLNRDNHKAVVN